MPQVLKDEVREEIQNAALRVFSKNGFLKTRMNDIALEAGVSTGNLYRYFQNKQEVFDHVFPVEFAEEFVSLFRKRVSDLSKTSDWTEADGFTEGAAKSLLEFMISHRERSLILLEGAEGTPYANVKAKLVDELTKSAINYFLGNKRSMKQDSSELVFIVTEILTNTLTTMTNTLRSHHDPNVIRGAINTFWRYHLAGLQALLKGK